VFESLGHSVHSAVPLPAFHLPKPHSVHSESSLVMVPSWPAIQRQSVMSPEPCMSESHGQPLGTSNDTNRRSHRGRGGGSLRIRADNATLTVCRRIRPHFAHTAFRIWVHYRTSVPSITLAVCDYLERFTDDGSA
jgi:hypothetical protein